MYKLTFILSFFSALLLHCQNELVPIKSFGSNPGNLKLWYFEPENISGKAPLVVVLHGCTQTAKSCAEQSGWNKLAKKHQFYVLYPEQQIINNVENCFNWYRSNDQVKDKGEPLSIMQMIQFMKLNKSIDTSKIYVVGLSAGGAMSAIMLSVYPEIFDKGAVIGGGPYKSAESVLNAGPAMLGMISKSPEDWGNLIKEQNLNYKGSYPELAIVHGNLDPVVNINNANQLIKQWINIHHTDYEEDEHFDRFRNNEDVELSIYKNNLNESIVFYFRIRNMGHALAIDTGNCDNQGGKKSLFSVDKDFHSTFWLASFFGIIKQPYKIEGPTNVKSNSSQLTYSIPYHDGSTYQWNTPAGMWIIGNKDGNSIQLSVDHQSGEIEVVEITTDSCESTPCKLLIEVKE